MVRDKQSFATCENRETMTDASEHDQIDVLDGGGDLDESEEHQHSCVPIGATN